MTMARNDRTRQNHDALFPARQIDLATQLLPSIGFNTNAGYGVGSSFQTAG